MWLISCLERYLALVVGIYSTKSTIFYPENISLLHRRIATMWPYRLEFYIYRRLIFPYNSKTKGMLLCDKSFCLFENNGLPLAQKNFTILTQKIKPVEEWKDTGVNCQYWAGILSYLEDSSFVIILYPTECSSLTNLFVFLRKWLAIASKKFHHFNSKNKTSRGVESHGCLLSKMAGILGYLEDPCFRIILKRIECFFRQIILLFWDKWLAIVPRKFHHFNLKNKTSRRVERYGGLLSILG